MTKRMIIMLLLAGLVFGGIFGMKWFGNKMMVQFVENMPAPRPSITAGSVEEMTWDNSLEAIGSFVAVNGADVTTEIGGLVTAIHFDSGAQVSKGQLLVTLEAASERAELQRLKAQSELAALNRDRREKLFKLEAISKSDYDAVVTEAAAADAALASQAAKLAQKEIRAPFAGTLGIRRINVGQFLTPGTAIVALQSLDPIEVDFFLPEQRMAEVQPGFAVEVTTDSYPGEVFKGKVLAVEPRIDAATRNFSVRARLPNADRKLRPGLFGSIKLNLPGEKTLAVIPRTAVNYSSYGTSVFVLQKMKTPLEAVSIPGMAPMAATDTEVIQRFVKLGEARGDFIAVTEGLKAGDRVATSGLLKLRNGQPVVVDNSVAPKPELNPAVPAG